jgi:hypothetical protein
MSKRNSSPVVWVQSENILIRQSADRVTANIFFDEAGVTLSVNGYRFECASVEQAKVEAEDRIRNNREVYLRRF